MPSCQVRLMTDPQLTWACKPWLEIPVRDSGQSRFGEYDAAMPEPGTRPPSPAAPRVYTARGQVDGEDWAGVAHALNERMASLRVGQQELAQRSGVSVSTLRQLQHGASRRVQNRTLAAI